MHMKHVLTTTGKLGTLALAVLSLASLAPLRQPDSLSPAHGVQDKQDPGKQDKALPVPASSAGYAFSLRVSGLSKEGASKLSESIQALTQPGFICTQCKIQRPEKGTCPGCKGELKRDEKAIKPVSAAKIELDPEDMTHGTLRMSLAPGTRVRLSEIEHALVSDGASIDRDALPIVPWARLDLAGVASEQALKKIEEGVEQSKPFEIAHAKFASGKAYLVLRSASSAKTLGEVQTSLQKIDGSVKIADIVLSAPCDSCAKRGMKQAGCADCWKERT
jgi:hypothetical protein